MRWRKPTLTKGTKKALTTAKVATEISKVVSDVKMTTKQVSNLVSTASPVGGKGLTAEQFDGLGGASALSSATMTHTDADVLSGVAIQATDAVVLSDVGIQTKDVMVLSDASIQTTGVNVLSTAALETKDAEMVSDVGIKTTNVELLSGAAVKTTDVELLAGASLKTTTAKLLSGAALESTVADVVTNVDLQTANGSFLVSATPVSKSIGLTGMPVAKKATIKVPDTPGSTFAVVTVMPDGTISGEPGALHYTNGHMFNISDNWYLEG